MGFITQLLGIDQTDTVIVVGGDRLLVGVGATGTPWAMPAYITVHAASQKVLAVGEEARQMAGREPKNLRVHRFFRHGGFGGEFDLAEAGLRYALKVRSPRRLRSPRVIAVCRHETGRAVKDAAMHAGAREIITLRPAMAAALGVGLKVEEPDLKAVFVLERDWCAFGLISLSGFVAEFELSIGIDTLLEDVALHALATRNIALDLDALHTSFIGTGLTGGDMLGWEAWLDDLETGRVTSTNYPERDFTRSALPFLWRLRWHYRRALETADRAKTRDSSTARLHLLSPYAKTPGLAALIGRAFAREVVVPESGELAMVRGGQEFLKGIDELYRVAAKW